MTESHSTQLPVEAQANQNYHATLKLDDHRNCLVLTHHVSLNKLHGEFFIQVRLIDDNKESCIDVFVRRQHVVTERLQVEIFKYLTMS